MATVNPRSADNGVATMPWSLVEKIDEQRAYPRLELNIPISFRNENGQRCTGQVVNLSPDGVRVRCNISAAQILHPMGGRICASNAPIVQLSMKLPLRDAEKRLVVGGRLVYAGTQNTEPRCTIGLKFLEQRPTAQKLLDQFFAEKMHDFYEDELISAAL